MYLCAGIYVLVCRDVLDAMDVMKYYTEVLSTIKFELKASIP